MWKDGETLHTPLGIRNPLPRNCDFFRIDVGRFHCPVLFQEFRNSQAEKEHVPAFGYRTRSFDGFQPCETLVFFHRWNTNKKGEI
jgi:hypothetical protein